MQPLAPLVLSIAWTIASVWRWNQRRTGIAAACLGLQIVGLGAALVIPFHKEFPLLGFLLAGSIWSLAALVPFLLQFCFLWNRPESWISWLSNFFIAMFCLQIVAMNGILYYAYFFLPPFPWPARPA